MLFKNLLGKTRKQQIQNIHWYMEKKTNKTEFYTQYLHKNLLQFMQIQNSIQYHIQTVHH